MGIIENYANAICYVVRFGQFSICTSFIVIAVTFTLGACSEKNPEDDIFTLYSTNYPHDYGRSGVATYDLAKEPFNGMMCQETAELHQADFEKRKKENGWSSDTKMRYWREKGRFKK